MTRKKNDFYPSEPAMVHRLIEKCQSITSANAILEPCAGDGAISNALIELGYRVYTNDLIPGGHNFLMDANDEASWEHWQKLLMFDWVITNPPYSDLDNFLKYSLEYASTGVAMILRLSALEPAETRVERGKIMKKYADNLRYVMPFSSPRPSFTRDGKVDSVTTAWFVWIKKFHWSRIVGLDSPFQFITNWK